MVHCRGHCGGRRPIVTICATSRGITLKWREPNQGQKMAFSSKPTIIPMGILKKTLFIVNRTN